MCSPKAPREKGSDRIQNWKNREGIDEIMQKGKKGYNKGRKQRKLRKRDNMDDMKWKGEREGSWVWNNSLRLEESSLILLGFPRDVQMPGCVANFTAG